MLVSNRKRSRCYPTTRPIMDDECPEDRFCEREHATPPVFLESIKTDTNNRTYTFAPKAQERFSVRVDFPNEGGYASNVSVSADNVHPTNVTRALAFVMKNEYAFEEAWRESRPRNERRWEISPDTFGKAI